MTNNKFGINSGVVRARRITPTIANVDYVTGAATASLNASKGEVFNLSPSSSITVSCSGISPNVSQRVTLIVTTNSTSSWVLTFNSTFVTTGTLTTGVTSGKIFIIDFVSNGTKLIEVSRTTAM